jgi:tRNA-guanine family transglycosylase
VKLFQEGVSSFGLDIVTPLSDTLPSTPILNKENQHLSIKRIIKSVDRSLKFLDECIGSLENKDTRIFGIIQGSYSEIQRKRSAEETIKRNIDGVLLEGFYLGESEEERVKLLSTTLSVIPSNYIRMIHGCILPEHIIQMVYLGIDLFDSTYPFMLANEGYAWTVYSLDSFEKLHLKKPPYEEDRTPLSKECSCFACKNSYMRGYIHHLLNTREMLAYILLSM